MASRHFRLVSAATTNLTQVGVYPGKLNGYVIINNNAAARYVKFYDALVPVVGTTTPVLTLLVPATSQISFDLANGAFFGNAMWIATTANLVDSDTTAVSARDLYISLFVE